MNITSRAFTILPLGLGQFEPFAAPLHVLPRSVSTACGRIPGTAGDGALPSVPMKTNGSKLLRDCLLMLLVVAQSLPLYRRKRSCLRRKRCYRRRNHRRQFRLLAKQYFSEEANSKLAIFPALPAQAAQHVTCRQNWSPRCVLAPRLRRQGEAPETGFAREQGCWRRCYCCLGRVLTVSYLGSNHSAKPGSVAHNKVHEKCIKHR